MLHVCLHVLRSHRGHAQGRVHQHILRHDGVSVYIRVDLYHCSAAGLPDISKSSVKATTTTPTLLTCFNARAVGIRGGKYQVQEMSVLPCARSRGDYTIHDGKIRDLPAGCTFGRVNEGRNERAYTVLWGPPYTVRDLLGEIDTRNHTPGTVQKGTKHANTLTGFTTPHMCTSRFGASFSKYGALLLV